nr:ribonuclease H-like domain-containing protein [Tanacetum cinerariifolium]
FTRDNNCTVEFDAFGFSVNDFLTRHILLRCDGSGDLYPDTSPSSTPHALLSVSPSTWHQRLGHPEEELGKHVRLSFSSSNSIVSRSFEIVHSNIWTSPIVSSGGFKYFEDIDYFKDFENEFSAIVYKDALTSEPKVSSEPTTLSTATFVTQMRRIFIMCCFDVRLLRLLCAEFVVGGLLTGSHGLLFRTGMRGSLTSGFFRRLSAYWKAFFVSLGGPYGSCGTALYLMLLLLPARRSLMI